jgi:hypothetical protein
MEIQPTTKVHCPICANALAGEVLIKYKVTATTDRETGVGGLGVFMCSAGHVFFIRQADMVFAENLNLALVEQPGKHRGGLL